MKIILRCSWWKSCCRYQFPMGKTRLDIWWEEKDLWYGKITWLILALGSFYLCYWNWSAYTVKKKSIALHIMEWICRFLKKKNMIASDYIMLLVILTRQLSDTKLYFYYPSQLEGSLWIKDVTQSYTVVYFFRVTAWWEITLFYLDCFTSWKLKYFRRQFAAIYTSNIFWL